MANAVPVPKPTTKDWARFMSKVRIDPSGCWEWTGGKFTQGYGAFVFSGKTRRAHRVLYVWLNGELPEGRQLDHLCRNRLCVNPAHLEPTTGKENVLRSESLSAQNARKTHCIHGHLLDGDNLHIDPSTGWRSCQVCRRIKQKERHPGPHNGVKTHCKNGHPFSGDNLIVTSKQRSCRTCARARNQSYTERKRAKSAI